MHSALYPLFASFSPGTIKTSFCCFLLLSSSSSAASNRLGYSRPCCFSCSALSPQPILILLRRRLMSPVLHLFYGKWGRSCIVLQYCTQNEKLQAIQTMDVGRFDQRKRILSVIFYCFFYAVTFKLMCLFQLLDALKRVF